MKEVIPIKLFTNLFKNMSRSPAATPTSIEDWISRPQERKTLRSRPITNDSGFTTQMAHEGMMVDWLRNLAKYGSQLEQYNDAKHALEYNDLTGGRSRSTPGAMGGVPFPRFNS